MRKIILLCYIAVSSLNGANQIIGSLIKANKRNPQCNIGLSRQAPRSYSSGSKVQSNTQAPCFPYSKKALFFSSVVVSSCVALAYLQNQVLEQNKIDLFNSTYDKLKTYSNDTKKFLPVQIAQAHSNDLALLEQGARKIKSDFPLALACESWQDACEYTIPTIFAKAFHLTKQHAYLTDRNKKSPNDSFNPAEFNDLVEIQEKLKAAIITIKQHPDFSNQIEGLKQERNKRKIAAEKEYQERRRRLQRDDPWREREWRSEGGY